MAIFSFSKKKEPIFQEEVVEFERDTSSDTEDGESFSGEDEEHTVENFMWCSFAHFCVQSVSAGLVARGDV